MILPTTYWGTEGWWRQYGLQREAQIEVMESFPKQTYRNRCTILDATGKPLTLSVPVQRVESKQMTQDVEISYQTRWQHQHWMAIMSAYKKTPYFDYYQDFIRPLYEKQTRWLVDLNAQTQAITESLLRNQMPHTSWLHMDNPAECDDIRLTPTTDWGGQDMEGLWAPELCILDSLFRLGPESREMMWGARNSLEKT